MSVDSRTVEDTDKNVYAQIIAEYGEDSSQAKVEVYGEFPSAGEDQFIYDTVRGRAVSFSRIYGGKMVENICQALARIIIGEQMLMIAKKYHVVMTVHDSVVALVPEHEADAAQADIEALMKVRPSWALELPLSCEAGSGKSYGGC
jgi:DNA polymerase